MPAEDQRQKLIAQRQPTSPEQDIQNMQGMYRGMSQFGNRPQPMPQSKAPEPPSQQTQSIQAQRSVPANQYQLGNATPAKQRFPTPSFARVGQGMQNTYQGVLDALGKGFQGARNMTPWGDRGEVTQGYNNYNPKLYADVGNYNRGVDIRAQQGTMLRAPRDLQVRDIRKNGWNTGWGNTVELFDPQSQEAFRFSHLADTANLSPGDIVRRGMGFGRTGNTGRTTAPHLDLEYQRAGQLADVRKHYPQWFTG